MGGSVIAGIKSITLKHLSHCLYSAQNSLSLRIRNALAWMAAIAFGVQTKGILKREGIFKKAQTIYLVGASHGFGLKEEHRNWELPSEYKPT